MSVFQCDLNAKLMLAFLVIGQIVSSNYVSGKNEGRSVE